MGYETLVGDMGSALSGGQKQRIVLARAIYRKPAILLMDEATSHLDNANEEAINLAVGKLRMTRVVIAHRESTLAMTDRVLNLASSQDLVPREQLQNRIGRDRIVMRGGPTNRGRERGRRRSVWKCFVRTVLICSAFLGSAAYAEDVEGASDHALLSRFPTTTIRAYQVREFDVAILPAGRIDDGEAPWRSA